MKYFIYLIPFLIVIISLDIWVLGGVRFRAWLYRIWEKPRALWRKFWTVRIYITLDGYKDIGEAINAAYMSIPADRKRATQLILPAGRFEYSTPIMLKPSVGITGGPARLVRKSDQDEMIFNAHEESLAPKESLWSKMRNAFGRAPICPVCKTKMFKWGDLRWDCETCGYKKY